MDNYDNDIYSIKKIESNELTFPFILVYFIQKIIGHFYRNNHEISLQSPYYSNTRSFIFDITTFYWIENSWISLGKAWNFVVQKEWEPCQLYTFQELIWKCSYNFYVRLSNCEEVSFIQYYSLAVNFIHNGAELCYTGYLRIRPT